MVVIQCIQCGEPKVVEASYVKVRNQRFCSPECVRLNRSEEAKKSHAGQASKVCPRCKTDKPLSEFSKNSKRLDGVQFACKACTRTKNLADYHSSEHRRKKIRENADRQHDHQQELICSYLESNPCVDCGEADIVVLEFDHRNGKTKAVSQMIGHCSDETLMKEIDKCDVRCANCHRRRHSSEKGYYRERTRQSNTELAS